MTGMAKYMLTGIDDEDWKKFKAYCDLQGVTLKDMLIGHINLVVKAFKADRLQAQHDYHKQKKGGNKA
jgi:hypothetical protein